MASRQRIALYLRTNTWLSSSYPDATTKIYRLSFKSWTHCHPVCISTSWESLQLVHTYLKQCMSITEMISKEDECDSISIYVFVSSIYTWAHFQVWTTEIIINIYWHLCGLKCFLDILEEYHLGVPDSPLVQRPRVMMNQLYSTQTWKLCLPVAEVNSNSHGGKLHNVWPQIGIPAGPLHTLK